MSLKAGRPMLGAAKRRRLSMTLKPELAARLERQAIREGLSTSRLAEGLLTQAIDQRRQEIGLWQARLGVPQASVAALCRALGVRRLALFGSVRTDRFGPGSDVELLVEFKRGVVRTLLDRGRIQMEFEALFNRPVDLVELRHIDNPLKRLFEHRSQSTRFLAGSEFPLGG